MSIKSNKFLRFFGTVLAILVLVELGARAGTWVFLKFFRFHGCAPYGEFCEFASLYGPVDSPRYLIHNPDLGFDVKPNFKNFDNKQRMISTDSNGLRSERERSLTKDPTNLRILAVGDSMMFGIGADDQGTITAHLEKSFNNVEVLNAGTPGYGLDQVYLKAKTMMKRFSPDVLLVGLITHDLDRLTTRHFSGAKPVFKKVDEKWTLTGSPVPTRQQRLKRQLPLIIALPKLLLDISLRPSPSETDETIAELGEWLILEMRREAQKQNARPIFVLMPWRFELDPTQDMGLRGQKQYELLLQTCNQNQLECIDLFPQFRQVLKTHGWQDFEAQYLQKEHLSSKGYEIVAKAVGEYLNLTPVSTQ